MDLGLGGVSGTSAKIIRGGKGRKGRGTINPAHFVICAWREGCVWDPGVKKDFSCLGWDGSFRTFPRVLAFHILLDLLEELGG